METLLQDLRYTLRTLRRSPGFTAVAALSLALGIGANTAIFTVLDAALLRSLPVEQPGELVMLRSDRGSGRINANFSYPLYAEARAREVLFEDVMAVTPADAALGAAEGAVRLRGEVVSGNAFSLLGVHPALGRAFTDGDDARGSDPTVVIGHHAWQQIFGGNAGIIGRSIRLNDRPFLVIGVAPAPFYGLRRGVRSDFWIPLEHHATLTGRDFSLEPRVSWLTLVGRLREGEPMQAASARLGAFQQSLLEQELFPAREDEPLLLESGARGITSELTEVSAPMRVLMAAVGVVLLIACANIANLLLARARARTRELAIRLSVGASRARVARQLLTESALLALLGGGLGLLFAVWGVDVLSSFRPPTGASLTLDTGFGARVLGFTLAVSLGTGLLFGLAPAIQVGRENLAGALRDGAAGSGRARSRLRDALVATQVALSLVLLFGAGLLLQSLRNLSAVDLGFRTERALLGTVDLDAMRYEPAEGVRFYDELLTRFRALPGVRAASMARSVTPHPYGSAMDGVRLEGYEAGPTESIGFDLNLVGTSYFDAMRIDLLRGRAFDERDARGAPTVAIINESMARRYWPGADPVGRRIFTAPDAPEDPSVLIVGVARDGRYRSVREEAATIVYLPAAQNYRPSMTLILSTDGDPAQLAGPLRRTLAELDAGVPLHDVRTLEQHIDTALSQDRMAAALTSSFALLALLLAAVGLYGVVSYSVTQRTREIGLRMALGARRLDVVEMVVRRAMGLVAAGVAVGVLGAFLAGRVLQGLLFGLTPADPLAVIGATVVLATVALVASLLPARRAAGIDPLTALRGE